MRLRAATLFLVSLICCLAASGGQAGAVKLPPGFRDETVFKGLQEPTALRFAPDGRVFVAEKSGKVMVFDSLEDETPTEFVDLSELVYDHQDRGLLGLALDPNFDSGKPYVYLLYTYDHVLGGVGLEGIVPRWGNPEHPIGDFCPEQNASGVDDCPVSGRLVRLTAVGDHAKLGGGGEPEEKVLVEDWCQQDSSHSIGDLAFDSSGALYASGGDGASFNNADYGQYGWPHLNECGDPGGAVGTQLEPPTAEGGALRSQDLRTSGDPAGLDGSIIRIDPETGEGLPSNPLAESSDPNARRIIAYGFRNPFRFAIDPESEEIYSGNVGWDTWEEIDRLPLLPSSPYNSGWPCYEGNGRNPIYEGFELGICQGLYAEPSAVTPPFFTYKHHQAVIPGDSCFDEAIQGSAISGLAVYPKSGPFPADYAHALFFADSVRGCIYVAFAGDDGRPDPSTVTNFMSQGGLYPGVDLEIGPEGNLYYAKIFGDEEDGTIHRISYDPKAPVARLSADHTYGPLNLTVHFDATASTDPQNGPLSYAWDLDGDGAFDDSTSPTPQHTYTSASNVTVGVQVEDGEGKTSVDKVVIYPGDTPPQPEITAPVSSLTWGVGQQIAFAGVAPDSEEGPLPPAKMRWSTRILHCPDGCHAHPYQGFPGVASGTLTAPDHEFPSSIVFILTATDSRGLSATKSVQVAARGVTMRVTSDPPGITLGAGSTSGPGPLELTAIEGGEVTLSAPPTAEVDGSSLEFEGWSDGGARVHSVAAGTATYTARFGPAKQPPPEEELPQQPRAHTKLSSHPAKLTHRRSASFAFQTDAEDVRYRCRIDSNPYAFCHSPRVYNGLRLGRHAFRVLAVEKGDGRALAPVKLFRWRVLRPGR